MKRKWKYSLGLFGSTLLIMSACGEVEETGGGEMETEEGEVDAAVEAGEDAPTIGFTVINQEAWFFTEMVKGAENAAEELDVNLTVFNANNDSVAQYNGAEDYISSGVDALVINAIDVEAMKPIVERAEEEGIPVISIDSIIEHDAVDVQIGVDNYDSSVELGHYFNEYAEETWGDEDIKIGAVSALNSPIQINRQDGFMDTILENENIELVNTVDGENVQERALSASEDLLTANPDLQAAFATGEPAFIGMTSGVRSQQRQDDLKLFGWDLSEQVIEGIDEGYVEAVLQQHPDEYGASAIESAHALLNGEEVEAEIDIPASIVTEENVDDFRYLFE